LILSLTGVFLSNNVEEKILHGTTTVGIKAKDGVILCADMRASAGYFIANIIAVRAWELGRDKTGEYFGRY